MEIKSKISLENLQELTSEDINRCSYEQYKAIEKLVVKKAESLGLTISKSKSLEDDLYHILKQDVLHSPEQGMDILEVIQYLHHMDQG